MLSRRALKYYSVKTQREHIRARLYLWKRFMDFLCIFKEWENYSVLSSLLLYFKGMYEWTKLQNVKKDYFAFLKWQPKNIFFPKNLEVVEILKPFLKSLCVQHELKQCSKITIRIMWGISYSPVFPYETALYAIYSPHSSFYYFPFWSETH